VHLHRVDLVEKIEGGHARLLRPAVADAELLPGFVDRMPKPAMWMAGRQSMPLSRQASTHFLIRSMTRVFFTILWSSDGWPPRDISMLSMFCPRRPPFVTIDL
jgi:hypothetical protein